MRHLQITTNLQSHTQSLCVIVSVVLQIEDVSAEIWKQKKYFWDLNVQLEDFFSCFTLQSIYMFNYFFVYLTIFSMFPNHISVFRAQKSTDTLSTKQNFAEVSYLRSMDQHKHYLPFLSCSLPSSFVTHISIYPANKQDLCKQ